jgi:hypothetical protein
MADSLTQARAAFIALYAQDVAANPDCYQSNVRANPCRTAENLIDGLTVAEIRQFTNDLRQEMRQVKQLTGRS